MLTQRVLSRLSTDRNNFWEEKLAVVDSSCAKTFSPPTPLECRPGASSPDRAAPARLRNGKISKSLISFLIPSQLPVNVLLLAPPPTTSPLITDHAASKRPRRLLRPARCTCLPLAPPLSAPTPWPPNPFLHPPYSLPVETWGQERPPVPPLRSLGPHPTHLGDARQYIYKPKSIDDVSSCWVLGAPGEGWGKEGSRRWYSAARKLVIQIATFR